MNKKILPSILFFAMSQSTVMADNWAHWRGPTGNGAAPDAHPPVEWSSTKNVKWKVAIPGRGTGSPVIWKDRVFVVTAIADTNNSARQAQSRDSRENQDRRGRQDPRGNRGRRRRGGDRRMSKQSLKILCFDRNTGRMVWEQTATESTPHQGTHRSHGYASASPCTDGEHVYAYFGSRGLFCYTMAGKLKWKRDDFGKMSTRNSFGEGSSVTLAGDKILVPWDHEGPSYLYALDKLTGKTIWKTERDEPTCWSTPLVVEHNGAKQVVLNGQTCARAYDLEAGKELWRCAGQSQRPIASAVAMDDLVIVGSGHKGSFMGAFRMNGKGDIENTKHVVWSLDRDTPDIASPLLSAGRLYFHKGKSGMLSCVDAATGKLHYAAARIPGISNTYASPVAAGGHVYLTGRRGTTVVIKDSVQLNIVASNSLGESIDATPAPVDNQLFIRGERHLFCISE